MEFRTVGDESIRCPILDIEELSPSDISLSGHFDYDECQVEDVDQVGVRGQGSLRHVVLSQGSLAESRFTDLELMDVAFRQVSLPNSSWERVTARRVEVIDCQAVGLQLGVTRAEDFYFEGCRLDYSNVDIEQHRGIIVFYRCTFKEAVLGGDLSKMVFSECDFKGAEFQARNAMNCDLTRSFLRGASGLLTMTGAVITGEQAMALSGQLAAEIGFVVT
ncbi:MAG TPA: pentapeptide repeat-containing protein [Pseudonocardiaceae bacterium]|nr:pentapeptide repeat-containing protein [Pseudonocardiaceae bacterium]